MTEHLPECPRSGCPACYEQGQHDCALTHAIRGLKDMNRIAARGYDDGHRDALDAAREAVKGVNWFNDGGKMLSAIVATAESLAAIDALREKP